jgi:hypothetical protein
MYKIGDKAIYYDGTDLTFKKVICTKKGCFYFFYELPYALNEEQFQMIALPLNSKKDTLQRQDYI